MKMIAKDNFERLYIQPAHIVDAFDLSRTTVNRFLKRMKENPKYKSAFIDLGSNLKLIEMEAFKNFLKEQHNKYLKE
ncbi:hypothetical protein [Megamonas hypermegale]|uniref:hypothetical protein n=1 Tax=Megamonas hypermegale TaxID=158847 RepID=UPI0026ED0B89|nr:hypothetical protein [Megamonas hypermegale]